MDRKFPGETKIYLGHFETLRFESQNACETCLALQAVQAAVQVASCGTWAVSTAAATPNFCSPYFYLFLFAYLLDGKKGILKGASGMKQPKN